MWQNGEKNLGRTKVRSQIGLEQPEYYPVPSGLRSESSHRDGDWFVEDQH